MMMNFMRGLYHAGNGVIPFEYQSPRSSMKRDMQKGFTLIELLVALAVVFMLVAVSIIGFRTLTGTKSVDAETARTVAELTRARSLTLGSQSADQYGVHL